MSDFMSRTAVVCIGRGGHLALRGSGRRAMAKIATSSLMAVLGSSVCLLADAPDAIAAKPSSERSSSEDFEVSLRDGSFYRGILLELAPRDHVTIRLATGEIKRFPWSKVKQAEPISNIIKQTTSADDDDDYSSSPSKPPSKDSVPSEDRTDSTIHVVIEGDNPQAKLVQFVGVVGSEGSSESWKQVCVFPCGVRVSPHMSYRVEGPFPTSSAFVLPQGTETVRLQVKSGSKGGVAIGATLTSLGVGSIVGGQILVGMGFGYKNDELLKGGGIWLGAGVLASLIGIPVWVTSVTKVNRSTGERVALLLKSLATGHVSF